MQAHDPPPNPSSPYQNTPLLNQPTMNGVVSTSIDARNPSPPPLESEATAIRNNEEADIAQSNGDAEIAQGNEDAEIEGENRGNGKVESKKSSSKSSKNGSNDVVVVRKERPTRACAVRAKLYKEPPLIELRSRPAKKVKFAAVVEEDVKEEEEEAKDGEDSGKGQSGKIITPLVNEPPPGQIPRWNLRAMWELASILNFLNVFRPLLNITVEFSAEEFETSLITPNDTLSYIHIPLLKTFFMYSVDNLLYLWKNHHGLLHFVNGDYHQFSEAIPPVTRMACGRETWVTVLCRKLRDWWHWVADGDLPIVAAHGAEIEAYKSLDPAVRVVILKALCDIRVEQEDIRSYIDDRMKHGIQLSTFRKERIGGDSHGISYWYEDDAIIGHRLYREMRKVEVKKAKIKGSKVLPSTAYEWETVATNLDEFQDVSEKLFSSNNRTEASLGKKLKNGFLPEIEKIYKRREKLLKKQQREALLLDSFVNVDGLMAGRSLRDRKPVTYTFDAYDRSINEAIKITKQKQSSPEKREAYGRPEPSANGTWSEPSHAPENGFFSPPSPPDSDDEMELEDHKSEEQLDRSDRRRRRPQRYSEKEFVEEVSDNDRNSDSDDDIVGEAVYDEEYLKRKKRKRTSSGSEGDEEYHWSEENGEEEEEEEEEDYSSSMSDDSDGPRKSKKLPGRTRKETKSRLSNDLQSGLRRSRRSTRNRVNYQQYELSDSDQDSAKQGKSNASETESHSAGSDNEEFTMESPDSDAHGDREEMVFDMPQVEEGYPIKVDEKQELPQGPSDELNSANEEMDEVGKTRFLDLNEAAPGSGFDDGPSALMKDASKNDS